MMLSESLQAPELVAQRLACPDDELIELANEIRKRRPSQLVTIARGSSDHAASYLAYLFAKEQGFLPVSVPPSLVTLHDAPLKWDHALVLAISQSGASPDICTTLHAARRRGALAAAFINERNAPLSRSAQFTVPIGAGREEAIAATKSYILSLAVSLKLLALVQDSKQLLEDLALLPSLLKAASHARDGNVFSAWQNAEHLIVLSRGLGLPIAQEVALKCNEVCHLHAMVYSSAEFRHGPMALIRKGDPVLILGIRGPELEGLVESAKALKLLGADVVFIAPLGTPWADLEYETAGPLCFDPLVMIQRIYPWLARFSLLRGLNPDQPMYLSKVTETL